jgi:hypothetical protein
MGSAFHCNHIKPDGLAIHNNRELPDFRNLPNRGNTQLHSNITWTTTIVSKTDRSNPASNCMTCRHTTSTGTSDQGHRSHLADWDCECTLAPLPRMVSPATLHCAHATVQRRTADSLARRPRRKTNCRDPRKKGTGSSEAPRQDHVLRYLFQVMPEPSAQVQRKDRQKDVGKEHPDCEGDAWN